MTVKQHFVTFYSPGTFVAEDTTKPIDDWSVEKAVRMADEISERYGATPYGFRFSTRKRGDADLDSKITAQSNLYFLGGVIETYDEVVARNNPSEDILRSNMQCNKWTRIITNTNSWKWTQPFEDDAVLLDYTPPKARKSQVRQ